MRYSSIKSIVAALSITVTLLAVAPAATAARVQGTRNQQTSARDADRETDRLAVVRQLFHRVVRRFTSNGGITIPVPAPSTGTASGTGTTTP